MSIEKFKKKGEEGDSKTEDFCLQCLAAPALAGAVAAAGTTKTENNSMKYVLYVFIAAALGYGLYKAFKK